ncbi:MAG: hypothetical protein M3Q97_04015, partial [Bacteroidota bacterium]|nr:hypothetical protein [Bacteroidota bacterium]
MRKFLLVVLTILFCAGFAPGAFGQCNSSTPTDTLDFTGFPDTVYTKINSSRSGNCCGDNNCHQFVITLDSNAAGIVLEVITGSWANGAGTIEFNCNGNPVGFAS